MFEDFDKDNVCEIRMDGKIFVSVTLLFGPFRRAFGDSAVSKSRADLEAADGSRFARSIVSGSVSAHRARGQADAAHCHTDAKGTTVHAMVAHDPTRRLCPLAMTWTDAAPEEEKGFGHLLSSFKAGYRLLHNEPVAIDQGAAVKAAMRAAAMRTVTCVKHLRKHVRELFPTAELRERGERLFDKAAFASDIDQAFAALSEILAFEGLPSMPVFAAPPGPVPAAASEGRALPATAAAAAASTPAPGSAVPPSSVWPRRAGKFGLAAMLGIDIFTERPIDLSTAGLEAAAAKHESTGGAGGKPLPVGQLTLFHWLACLGGGLRLRNGMATQGVESLFGMMQEKEIRGKSIFEQCVYLTNWVFTQVAERTRLHKSAVDKFQNGTPDYRKPPYSYLQAPVRPGDPRVLLTREQLEVLDQGANACDREKWQAVPDPGGNERTFTVSRGSTCSTSTVVVILESHAPDNPSKATCKLNGCPSSGSQGAPVPCMHIQAVARRVSVLSCHISLVLLETYHPVPATCLLSVAPLHRFNFRMGLILLQWSTSPIPIWLAIIFTSKRRGMARSRAAGCLRPAWRLIGGSL